MWSIGIHGGAGAMRTMSKAKERLYRDGLHKAVMQGAASLKAGAPATQAVIEAVMTMERSGDFNAGRGSCLNLDGHVQVDAAVMAGHDLTIGALAAVRGLTNAVEVAERIRTHSPHCLLASDGALRFAKTHDLSLDFAQPSEARLARYQQLLSAREGQLPQHAEGLTQLGGTHDDGDTVGAVALDQNGHLAVAVSTGGVWLKHPGRIGDSPLAGSGFWAEDQLGACTATGTGEFIIRAQLCQVVMELMRSGQSAPESGLNALKRLEDRFGGDKAGLVIIDADGRLAFPFHTQGMGRAAMWHGSNEPVVAVWPEEGLTQAAREFE